MGLRQRVPWWARIGLKIVLSRLPLAYTAWRRLGVFRHGEMQDPEHALEVFSAHFRRASSVRGLRPGFVALELGPGDAVSSGIVAKAYGASKTYLVDRGSYALRDVSWYTGLVRLLEERGGKPIPSTDDCRNFDDLLKRYDIVYLTDGQRSMSTIPDGSIDFVWSNVVLEHVPLSEFTGLITELRRILRPTGVMSHSVDLRDHLGGSLNNLRFSESTWESKFMSSSGFYTNRLRFSEMMDIFENCGFSVMQLKRQNWDSLPTSRSKLSLPYSEMTEEELRVAEFEVVLAPH